jgi:hypothetical protein
MENNKPNHSFFLSEEQISLANNEAKSACVVMFNPTNDGSVLAVSRKDNFNDLGLPGGKIEPGESPKIAAARELHEETGIFVKIQDLIPLYYGFSRSMMAMTYLALGPIEGKLIPYQYEGLPLWVNPKMLVQTCCTYAEYNKNIFNILNRNGYKIDV